ncbi:MAG TPA: hypothetical protein VG939_05885, partial [Caulobacteraceae bacterium]|nr:hypothetical protein [Caulobacteraceae bacterium]
PGAADTGALGALKDPRVWLLGLVSALMLGSNYAINLSAPAILQAATGLSAGKVGLLTAAVNAVAALAMLAAGWSSDRTGERRGHAAAFMAVIAAGFLATGLSAAGAVTVGAYAVYVVGASAIQAVIWLMPTDVLRGRSAAVGVAAIGSIGMVGAFVGPWAWGLARDATGDYRAGLLSLAVPFLAGAALVLAVRAPRRTLTTIGDIPGSA